MATAYSDDHATDPGAAEDAMWEEMERALQKAVKTHGYRVQFNPNGKSRDLVINGREYPLIDETSGEDTGVFISSVCFDVDGTEVDLEFRFDTDTGPIADDNWQPKETEIKGVEKLLTALLYIKQTRANKSAL